MSADNGYIIRKNSKRKFVLQQYFASADVLPSINNPNASQYDTLEEAVRAYSAIARGAEEGDYVIEYGLHIDIDRITE